MFSKFVVKKKLVDNQKKNKLGVEIKIRLTDKKLSFNFAICLKKFPTLIQTFIDVSKISIINSFEFWAKIEI